MFWLLDAGFRRHRSVSFVRQFDTDGALHSVLVPRRAHISPGNAAGNKKFELGSLSQPAGLVRPTNGNSAAALVVAPKRLSSPPLLFEIWLATAPLAARCRQGIIELQ